MQAFKNYLKITLDGLPQKTPLLQRWAGAKRPRQNPPNPPWGLLPPPGKAEFYTYPDCKDGLFVADVVRLGKGHTEGLEPKVTEELVKLMVSAKAGKIQQAR